jgi:SAM-dependent methyltransferase
MKTTEYATMAEREQTYWWHLGRLQIIQTYMRVIQGKKHKLKILNVGCGTGGTIDMLEDFGQTDNVDISDEAINFMRQNGYKRLTKVNNIELPFRDKTFDVVGAFDVLEHIEQEADALKEWGRVIKDDGAILLTVPAYQWLWSDHDVSLHHKRRYTIKSLDAAAKKAGLKLQRQSYAIVFSLPLVVGFRFVNKALGRKANSETSYVNVPAWINAMFTQLLHAEAKLHKSISFPAGTTVIAILRKNSS